MKNENGTEKMGLSAQASCSAATKYAPEVGDRFYRPAGRYKNSKGELTQYREQNANVVAISPGCVVSVINGDEWTMEHGDFVRLAARSLTNGATLIRDQPNNEVRRGA